MRLEFSDQAQDDLKRITAYIARRSQSRRIARRFKDKILAKCKELASIRGRIGFARPDLAPGIRSHPFGNYVIFFKYGSDSFQVVTILEGYRDIEALFRS